MNNATLFFRAILSLALIPIFFGSIALAIAFAENTLWPGPGPSAVCKDWKSQGYPHWRTCENDKRDQMIHELYEYAKWDDCGRHAGCKIEPYRSAYTR